MGIPEVDLGIEYVARVILPARGTQTLTADASVVLPCRSTKLKNIEATEKAKRSLQDARSARAGQDDGDEFAANRCKIPLERDELPLFALLMLTLSTTPPRSLPSSPCARI